MIWSKTIWEIGALLSLSVAIALLVNFLSPAGIPAIGQWDVNKGVVTADSKAMDVFHQREITRVKDAFLVYQQGGALFVDAREYDSYQEGHIKGAVSLFVYDYDERFEEFTKIYPDRGQLIVTYCSGRECEDSHLLAQYLSDDGYTRVKVFIDGFPAWAKEGLPVEND